MSYLSQIPKDTISVEVARKFFIPPTNKLVAKAELGQVVLYSGNKKVEMSTKTAHYIGLTIARAVPKLAPGELIVIKINTEAIELLPSAAKKISTALLLKADDADDWQLANVRRRK